MDRCLLGTSTLSDILQPPSKRLPAVAKNLKQYLRAHGRLTLSEVSCYEILRGLYKRQAAVQLDKFQDFCSRAELLPVSRDVLDRAARLWADGQTSGIVVDDADLIIAATAQLRGLRIATANSRHFAWIGGLKWLDWRDIPAGH